MFNIKKSIQNTIPRVGCRQVYAENPLRASTALVGATDRLTAGDNGI